MNLISTLKERKGIKSKISLTYYNNNQKTKTKNNKIRDKRKLRFDNVGFHILYLFFLSVI